MYKSADRAYKDPRAFGRHGEDFVKRLTTDKTYYEIKRIFLELKKEPHDTFEGNDNWELYCFLRAAGVIHE